MSGWWKWFLRPGEVVLDVVGQMCPDRGTPGRCRRRAGAHGVPDEAAGPGDGAGRAARLGVRRTPPDGVNQRAGRYQRHDAR
ncbi:hypothetical protein GA0074692_2082 [Micromonospora pallida]|uniref:Uncharacterized protein n=1 Tax=Micromonospora pallida TaxID=145854 RepID=A0A1C6S9D5_9ACTN|nr:hypothetical protein [Micromonospora pallida]SCL26085.1 hypothetical protein GA0074692_2082 [Micromonospora pallida]